MIKAPIFLCSVSNDQLAISFDNNANPTQKGIVVDEIRYGN